MTGSLTVSHSGEKICTITGAVSLAHRGDAGMDVFYTGEEDVMLRPLERHAFSTGVHVEFASGDFYIGVHPRSGLAFNHGITVLNAPGVVDSGYTGEVKVCLVNLSNQPYTVRTGDKIAQLLVGYNLLSEVEVHQSAMRGEGGFGSSGC